MTNNRIWSPWAKRWSLDPQIVFLNHGSFGACPVAVLTAQRAIQVQMERSPVAFMVRELPELLDRARGKIARFVGADPAGIAFVENATSGVNIALRCSRLCQGERVLVLDHGYNACLNAADAIAEQAGAFVDRVALPLDDPDGDLLMERLDGARTPQTTTLVIDHITSQSALIVPVERVCRWAKDHSVRVIIDGAHAPGHIQLDIESLGCAFYTGNLHKWVCAPKGAAILWVAQEFRDSALPLTISHGYNDISGDLPPIHRQFDWRGTHDPSAAIASAVALEVMAEMHPDGWPGIMAHNHQQAQLWAAELCEAIDGLEPLGTPSQRGAMVTLRLPQTTGFGQSTCRGVHPLQDWLWHHHQVEVPVFPGIAVDETWFRISSQLYLGAEAHLPLRDGLHAWQDA